MLQIKNRGFKKIYVYGGSGIFTPIANLATRLLGKEAVKRAATQVVQKAAAEVGKKAVSKLTSKSRDILNKRIKSSTASAPTRLTSKSQDILKRYSDEGFSSPREEFNLNALIDGSAIRIEDYVKSKGRFPL